VLSLPLGELLIVGTGVVAADRHGPTVLTAIAVGIGLFSVYCFARARHPVG
jgi:hypothetical protein